MKAAFFAALEERERQAQAVCDYPDIPFERVMRELLIAKGVKENADTLAANAEQFFRIVSIDYIRLYPNVENALRNLREQGFRLWLLTNAQGVFTEHELLSLGLDTLFDGIYISSDYGCRKPDIRFFRALTDGQQLDPDRCLMIGNDRQTDIAGGKAAGLATLYLHTNLTPLDQAAADPALHPRCCPTDCRHYEYEGCDWNKLTRLISAL